MRTEKVFEHVTNTIKDTSENISKPLTESSLKNNQALEILNNKLLEIMNDRRIMASYLLSSLFKITNPENTSQFKLVEDSNSNRVNGLLLHNTTPITLQNNKLNFRDTNREFDIKGVLLKMITSKIYIVDLASLSDKKLMYNFEMHFDIKAPSNKSTRDRTLIKLLESPAVMASGISNTILSPCVPNEFCDRLTILLQEKKTGISSDIIN